MSWKVHRAKLRPFFDSFLLAVGLISFLVGCGEESTRPLRVIEDGNLYNVAGQPGEAGNDGDNGPAVDSYLYWVVDSTVLPNGDILVMDWNNHRIRKITTDGVIHSFIGSGLLGDGVSGTGPNINFNHPTDIKVGPDGKYYVAAYHNWKIKAFDAGTLLCSIPVGLNIRGFSGDGGPATEAHLDLPSSLVFDSQGNMYIGDQGNMRIRKVDAQTHVITTFVGGGVEGFADGVGEAALFDWPGNQTTGTGTRGAGLELSPDGENIYVTDTENNRLRKINIATRMVTTIAGTGAAGYSGDGGSALSATFDYPTDVACSNSGDIYVADFHNHAIRRIDVNGTITTVAGTGVQGSSPDGTPAKQAQLNQPQGITFDSSTNTLYIADTYNHVLKMVRKP